MQIPESCYRRKTYYFLSLQFAANSSGLKTKRTKTKAFCRCTFSFLLGPTPPKPCDVSTLCSELCKPTLDGMCTRFQETTKTEWTTRWWMKWCREHRWEDVVSMQEVKINSSVSHCGCIFKSNANNKKYFKNEQHNVKVMIHSKGCARRI